MDKPLRIAFLTYRGNMRCGGQGVYTWYLVKELQRLGHKVTVINGPPYLAPLDGVPVKALPSLADTYDRFFPQPLWRLFHPVSFGEWLAIRTGKFPEPFTFSLRTYFYLRRRLKKGEFDLVHDNQSLGYGLLLLRRWVPVTATVHHPLVIDREAYLEQARSVRERVKVKRFFSFTLMQNQVVPRLDGLVTVSLAARRAIAQAFGVHAESVKVIYNGVDTKVFRPLGLSRIPNRLLLVANTEDRKKGVLYLFQALKSLPPEVKLTVVDQVHPQSYAFRLCKELGLEGRVTFTGSLPTAELVRQYNLASVAVVPSVYEGFGFPAAEAMACGTPVVATTGGALPEVVAHRETGLLVPPMNPQALGEAIRTLLEDPGLRERFGRGGRARVERMFTWEQAAREHLKFFQEVIHDYRRTRALRRKGR